MKFTAAFYLFCSASPVVHAFAPPRAFLNVPPSSSIQQQQQQQHQHDSSLAKVTSDSSSKSSSSSCLQMATAGAMSCRPIGIGSAAPSTIITNVDLESIVETDDAWIQARTGIKQRHVLTHGESIRDLQILAAQRALEMANVDAADLDVVICSTSSPQDMFGDAPSVAAALGCPTSTMSFDLTAACSGFLFGTVTAGKFLSAPNGKSQLALVIGADALSRHVDWDDRNTCILFGDGAGAMVLESTLDDNNSKSAGKEDGLLGYAAHSNGNGYADLTCG
jgi:3-oxoacyl-[acyl-carrier-protein] synthase III